MVIDPKKEKPGHKTHGEPMDLDVDHVNGDPMEIDEHPNGVVPMDLDPPLAPHHVMHLFCSRKKIFITHGGFNGSKDAETKDMTGLPAWGNELPVEMNLKKVISQKGKSQKFWLS
ncbi:hypothetical protein Ddc_24775 [Ditylenchus destructor]|nr:hypothetical protein Ddc_24775 [Ditylenchus destructor]